MKKKKFQRLMIAEAIALNQRILDLESKLYDAALDRAMESAFVDLKSAGGLVPPKLVRDPDGIPLSVPITDPLSIPLGEPRIRELIMYLPRRLNAVQFVATKEDMLRLQDLKIPFSYTPLNRPNTEHMYKAQFVPMRTTQSPRYIHMAVNELFKGRYSFVMEIRNV